MSTVSTVTSCHLSCTWGHGDPPSRPCTWGHMSIVTSLTPFPTLYLGSHVHSLHGDPLSQTLSIFYLLNAHPLTVLSGGSLVTKSCPILVTPWTVASEVPLSMRFSRQEYGSGLPFPSPGNLLDPGFKPGSPALQVDSLPTEL